MCGNTRAGGFAAFFFSFVATAMAETKALFLTGGQSNTDGRLYAKKLPPHIVAFLSEKFCIDVE